jgi:hypothetical protein
MVLPYLKGLVIIKCGFFYLDFSIYLVFSICGDYICRSIQVLNTHQRRSLENFASLGEYKNRGLVLISEPHRDQSFRVRIGTLQTTSICVGKDFCIRIY